MKLNLNNVNFTLEMKELENTPLFKGYNIDVQIEAGRYVVYVIEHIPDSNGYSETIEEHIIENFKLGKMFYVSFNVRIKTKITTKKLFKIFVELNNKAEDFFINKFKV